MLGPAGELEVIESGKDYSILAKKNPIFSIHCIKTNECDVIVTTIGGTSASFPPGSFVQGAIYHFYIRMVEFEQEKAGFIGYRSIHVDR